MRNILTKYMRFYEARQVVLVNSPLLNERRMRLSFNIHIEYGDVCAVSTSLWKVLNGLC